MRKISTFVIFLLPFLISFAQWQNRSNGLPENWTNSWALDALDQNVAIVSLLNSDNDNTLFKTADGGEFWTALSFGSPTLAVDISMISEDNILVCTYDLKILKTEDGGISWRQVYNAVGESNFLNYIEMFDENNGVCLGDAPNDSDEILLLKTNDGGETWNKIDNNLFGAYSGDIWRRVDFCATECGLFYNSLDKKLYRIFGSDAFAPTSLENIQVDVIKQYDNTKSVIISSEYENGNSRRYIKHYNPFDDSYTENEIPVEGYISDVEFIPSNPNSFWVATSNRLYFTNDDGLTWSDFGYDNYTDSPAMDLQFTDPDHGWLLSKKGVYKINNASQITDVSEISLPLEFKLYQNYPNPFSKGAGGNPETAIKFNVPKESFVSLKIYDVLGNEIQTLVNEKKSPGLYQIEFNGDNLSSGVYFYRLQAGKFSAAKKMILLR